MIRAPIGNFDYWDEWVKFSEDRIKEDLERISTPSKNPVYRPQFIFNLTMEFPRAVLRYYSRGDLLSEIPQNFDSLLDTWELSNKLAKEICLQHNLETCRDWHFSLSDLNHYNWCFWLVGLALCLDIPDDQWQRLILLIGEEGEDVLLDRVIASRQSDRKIGTNLLHKKPYQRLLTALNAPENEQPELLRLFVENWYKELDRKGKDQLWWYIYGDPEKHPLEMGSYFGRWCLEAVAVVKAFGIDDKLCLGHEHYPGDLLRPEGPTTHPIRQDTDVRNTPGKSWFKKLLGK
ncbi:MAG: PoNi-like cognate immunity protein [Amphritea sp.]|nr:PoNi-like cognate immunity protein [Amphritea sp.]